jgi:Polyketide cyclase / dehydrase and lipid transport
VDWVGGEAMHEIHGSATEHMAATAADVFTFITDIDRLPEWNAAIQDVIEKPVELQPGADWLVTMHPNAVMTWKSRSTVDAIDREACRFSYRTVNADGNPSYTLWTWDVAPGESGTTVSVKWDVYLKTWDRRLLGGPIRSRQLRKEVAASLSSIGRTVVSSS